MTRWLGDKTVEEIEATNKKARAAWPDRRRAVELADGRRSAATPVRKPKKAATVRKVSRGEAQLVQVSLPWPPSVNHYWRRNKGPGMHISDEGKAFQNIVAVCCLGLAGVMGRVAVRIIAFPPDRRARDLDNLLKSLLDALNHVGMIEDDALIDDLHIMRGEICIHGVVEVVITSL